FVWPQSALPSALSEGLTNVAEATAAVGIAKSAPDKRFIITSPFAAQCRCIASVAAEEAVENVRGGLPEKLGQRRVQPSPHLILSIAATDTATAASWPLNDLGQLAPLLIGDWSHITVLCAPALMRHHPLIRHLTKV